MRRMDALEQMIRTEEERLSKLRADVALQEIKVGTLKEAAALRPAPIPGKKNSGAARSGRIGGKPRGAISGPWKSTLAELYAHGGPYPYARIKSCYDYVNKADLALPSVRDRVRSLVETQLLEGDADTGFSVSEIAAGRFGFAKKTEAPVGSADGTPEGRAATQPNHQRTHPLLD